MCKNIVLFTVASSVNKVFIFGNKNMVTLHVGMAKIVSVFFLYMIHSKVLAKTIRKF